MKRKNAIARAHDFQVINIPAQMVSSPIAFCTDTPSLKKRVEMAAMRMMLPAEKTA
jgi:hypothetical protein